MASLAGSEQHACAAVCDAGADADDVGAVAAAAGGGGDDDI